MVAKKQENKSSQDVESSKNGDLKSRQSDRTKAERRNLGIILGTLCVLATVLAVLAIVIGVQKGNKTQESEVAEEQSGSTEEQAAKLAKEWQEAEAFQKSTIEFQGQVDNLLAKDSVKAEEIINLYNPKIEETPIEKAHSFIIDEGNALISKGYKREALEELTKRDYSDFSVMNSGGIYTMIIDLATELGEPEIVSKYSDLLNKAREAVPQINVEEVVNE